MKRVLATMCCVSLLATAASALEINVTPGTLARQGTLLSNTSDDVLKLTGEASVEDMAQLKHMSRTIKTLDMSGLSMPDNSVPASMLLGSSVTQLSLPVGITTIGNSAFAGSALTQFSVPVTVTSIGDDAFAHCPALVKVSITARATLGSGLFNNSKALRTVEFGYDIEAIPASTFDGCTAYAEGLPETVNEIGAYAYRGTALKDVDLQSVVSVGDFAFANMPDLESITYDMSHEITFGKGVFFSDNAVGMLPALGEQVPSLSFAHTAGSSVLNVTSATVGDAAYANNEAITELKIAPSVRTIGAHAFRNVLNLDTVNVKDRGSDIPEVDTTAFSGLENEEGRYDVILSVATGTENKWKEHPVWGLFNVANSDTGTESITDSHFDLKLRRSGSTVTVESTLPIDYLVIYTLDGITLYESRPATENVTADIDADGVLVVKAISGDHVKIAKLK